MLMVAAIAFTIATRVPAQPDVLRDRGALFSFNGEGRVENTYTLKIANMSEVPQTFTISVSGMEGIRILTQDSVTVASSENRSLPTVVDVAPEVISESNNDIVFTLKSQSDENLVLETESRFVGPNR
jgi:polyferredoxin